MPQYNQQPIKAVIELPGSKSISNRLLILKEVLGLTIELKNLSSAKDTQDLIKAIGQIHENKNRTINIGHAGTDMRFLTALLCIKEGEWVLTGSERMKERPIKELADALKQIGAQISYKEKEGFPPLKITGKKLSGGKIEIDGSISSQFVSALLLIAPVLEKGLEITVKNKTVSRPYILMTLDLLSEFGTKVSTVLNKIVVSNNRQLANRFQPSEYIIESDWSSASYWYSMVALASEAEVTLKGLKQGSSQGDSVLKELYKNFGVASRFFKEDLVLTKTPGVTKYFEYDFTDCPDLAQTVAVTCLGLNINARLTGLSTLKNKETDRLLALKTELEKFGAQVKITNDSLELQNQKSKTVTAETKISTYKDHRMAMSFAPLALIYNSITIENPGVVEKSYPSFWDHLKTSGIKF